MCVKKGFLLLVIRRNFFKIKICETFDFLMVHPKIKIVFLLRLWSIFLRSSGFYDFGDSLYLGWISWDQVNFLYKWLFRDQDPGTLSSSFFFWDRHNFLIAFLNLFGRPLPLPPIKKKSRPLTFYQDHFQSFLISNPSIKINIYPSLLCNPF